MHSTPRTILPAMSTGRLDRLASSLDSEKSSMAAPVETGSNPRRERQPGASCAIERALRTLVIVCT